MRGFFEGAVDILRSNNSETTYCSTINTLTVVILMITAWLSHTGGLLLSRLLFENIAWREVNGEQFRDPCSGTFRVPSSRLTRISRYTRRYGDERFSCFAVARIGQARSRRCRLSLAVKSLALINDSHSLCVTLLLRNFIKFSFIINFTNHSVLLKK